MENIFTGFAIGFLFTIGACLIICINRRRGKYLASTLDRDISKNNTDIRSGFSRSEAELEDARRVNTGLGNINKEAIGRIDATEKTVSDIINAAGRKIPERDD